MIKTIFVCPFLFVSLNLFAVVESPILSKISHFGFGILDYNTSTVCDVYNNKVVIVNIAGQGIAKQIKKIYLGGNLNGMIKDASMGPLIRNPEAKNLRLTTYSAYKDNLNGSLEIINLGILAGDTWKEVNQAAGSYGLRNLLDTLCN